MRHLHKGGFYALILLSLCIPIKPLNESLATCPQTNCFTENPAPCALTSKPNGLKNLLEKLLPLATKDDAVSEAKTLNAHLINGHKRVPTLLIENAILELENILESHHLAIPDDEEVRQIASQLATCKELIKRAPRPPLVPGGSTGSVGGPNPSAGSTSGFELPADVNIVRDLHVGNNAGIDNDLTVGGDAIIDGILTILGGTQYGGDIILQPIAPDTSIAIRFNSNTGTEIARIYTPSTSTNGLVISTDGGVTENLCVQADGSTTVKDSSLTVENPSSSALINLNTTTPTLSEWQLISGAGGTDNLQLTEPGVGPRIQIDALPGKTTITNDLIITKNLFAGSTGNGGLTVSSTTAAGNTNLRIEGSLFAGITTGGLHVGNSPDTPSAKSLLVDGTTTAEGSAFVQGGVHVGGTSDPGAGNLLVDGTTTTPQTILTVNGVDVTATPGTDTLNLGTTNADLINLGHTGVTITLAGSTNFTDPLATLNSTGAALSAHDAGIQLKEGGVITGYLQTSPDRLKWLIKPPSAGAGIITVAPTTVDLVIDQGLTLADSPTFANLTLTNNGLINFRESLPGTNAVRLRAAPSLPLDYTLTFPADDGNLNQILSTDGTGTLSWVNFGSSVNAFVNGGNAFSAPAIIGTTDPKALAIITDSTTRIQIANTAGSGVVTATPAVSLASSLDLATSTVVNKGGNLFIHSNGDVSNTFAGYQAGNAIIGGSNDTGLGSQALFTTDSSLNTAIGYHTLRAATAPLSNEGTAIGSTALSSCTTGYSNSAAGFAALSSVTANSLNSAIGHNALSNATGTGNCAMGKSSLSAPTSSGDNNVALGSGAGNALTSGSNNILLGKNAGSALTAEFNVLCIGTPGIAATSNATYIRNIRNTIISAPAKAVGITSDNQLGTDFVTPLDATTLRIGGDATFNNPIRTQYHRTSYVYATSPGSYPASYFGFFYTNGDANSIGPTNLDRLNFSFNFRDTTPSGGPYSYYMTNPVLYGSSQITLGHYSGGGVGLDGGAIVIGTNVIGGTPLSRFEIYPDGTINLASTNIITSSNQRYIHSTSGLNFYAGKLAGASATSAGTNNTGVGYQALSSPSISTAFSNTCVGYNAGSQIAGPSNSNVCIGANAGSSITNSGANSIFIGSGCLGANGDFGIIRLGNPTNTTCELFRFSVNDLVLAGSKWPAGTTRVSHVVIVPGGAYAGTSDILSVSRVSGRPLGAWRIAFVPLSARAYVVATDEQAEPTILSEWIVTADTTNNATSVYTFDNVGVLQDRNVHVLIMGIN
ncbi:TPA: hypothetical protein DDZ86_04515 [Candidatus Dependentiae bacterium]|nr:MAG: putative T4-like protein proximal tail fiber [candidate division TM6 bacterium GW2011_GWF2_43_87]HBL98876.1 hypothetical protein [Candidatus Dependentiae bacterium]